MAYLLVMGSVMLSIVVCLGWAAWALGRWCIQRLTPAHTPRTAKSRVSPSKKVTPKPRASAAKRTSSTAKPARASAKASDKAKPIKVEKVPLAPPNLLTRFLAKCRSTLPLGLFALFLFGVIKLAQIGMQARSEDVPAGYHQLVTVVGWAAVVLLVLAVLSFLALWRVSRYEQKEL